MKNKEENAMKYIPSLSMDPVERSNQLRSIAEQEAYYMMMRHKAPASLLQFFMDRDPDREAYKTDKIRAEANLASSKAEAITKEQMAAIDQAEVLEALKRYTGNFNRGEHEGGF